MLHEHEGCGLEFHKLDTHEKLLGIKCDCVMMSNAAVQQVR
jgi:hypothetical protein